MAHWLKTIRDQWHPPRDRVLWAPVFLGLGVALYFAADIEPAAAPTAGAVALMLVALRMAWRRFPDALYALFCLLLVVLGFGIGQMRTALVAAPMLERTINITRIEGRVVDVTTADDEKGRARRRVTLDSLVIEKLTPERTPAKIRLSTYHVPADVVPGDRIAMLARLMPPSGPVAPRGFDYRRQAYFEGIGATGFTMGKFERIAAAPQETTGLAFNTLRQAIAQRLSGRMAHPEGAVATALLAGERADIPDEVNDQLRDSGLYHILSISGLHVAIVCGVTFFALRFAMALWPWFALRVPIKKIAALGALAAGLAYSMLAGLPVPTQRSILMTGLVLLAVMLDRSALSMRTIALAAFFVLIFQPESLVGASFQLSFAAVLAMVAFHEGVGRKYLVAGADRAWYTRLFLYMAGIAITTVLVSFATLAPVLHHFGRMQFYGVIANALAIPLTSFVVMPAGMAALLLMPLGLEGPFLKIVEWGVAGMLDIARIVAGLPHAALALPSVTLGWYLAGVAGFLLLCLWRGTFRWVGLPVMIVSLAAGMVAPRPAVMIDAQGRSIAVHGGGETAYFGKTPTSFVRDNWRGLWGGREANGGKPVRDAVWQGGAISVACDDFACRIVKNGQGASILRSATATFEECNWAGVIVALDKAVGTERRQGCAAPLLTFWEMRAGGGVALYAGKDGWRMQTMTPREDRRPWTLRARRE